MIVGVIVAVIALVAALMGTLASARMAFASREIMMSRSDLIGTRNPLAARIVCLVVFMGAVICLGALVLLILSLATAEAQILWIFGSAFGILLGGFAIRARWNRAVAYIRVTHTPPGEAPADIRRAWVGLELPLRRREGEPRPQVALGVLSGQDPQLATGYVVDARKAVQCLASHSPEAAAWWRQNAPHVLSLGSRLFFPFEVCERVG